MRGTTLSPKAPIDKSVDIFLEDIGLSTQDLEDDDSLLSMDEWGSEGISRHDRWQEECAHVISDWGGQNACRRVQFQEKSSRSSQ